MKLINADKVIKTLRERKKLFCKNQIEFRMLPSDQKARVDEIDTCIAELVNAEEVPHAQLGTNLAEVVHCKDCKHWIPYDWMFSEVWQSKNIADYPEDEIGCNYCDMAMKANDFCSRGERRTDG